MSACPVAIRQSNRVGRVRLAGSPNVADPAWVATSRRATVIAEENEQMGEFTRWCSKGSRYVSFDRGPLDISRQIHGKVRW